MIALTDKVQRISPQGEVASAMPCSYYRARRMSTTTLTQKVAAYSPQGEVALAMPCSYCRIRLGLPVLTFLYEKKYQWQTKAVNPYT